MAITINDYTAKWDDAVRHRQTLRAGMRVRVHESSDGREYDAFCRRLADNGLALGAFVRWMPRAKLNVHVLEKA